MTIVANNVRLAEIPEATYGVTPATPAFKVLTVTGEGINFTPTTTTSQTLNPNRATIDSILTGGAAAGPLNFELAKSVWFEDFLAGVMCSTWVANVLKVGTALQSYTIEKTFPLDPTGATNSFQRAPGTIMNGLSLTVAPNAPITGNFDTLSKDLLTASAIIAGATYVAPAFSPIFTAPLVTAITISGIAAATYCFNNITLTVTNNARAIECIGTLGARSMALGHVDVTLAFSLYFADDDLLELLKSQATVAISFKLVDSLGNSYQFDIPKAKLTQCNVVAGGIDQDVVADCVAVGLYDSVTATPLTITRAPGPATLMLEREGEQQPAEGDEVRLEENGGDGEPMATTSSLL